MPEQEIADKKRAIDQRLKELDDAHKASRILIEAELLALQHVCPHANAKTSHDGGWGRMPSSYWDCPDCGKHKSSY